IFSSTSNPISEPPLSLTNDLIHRGTKLGQTDRIRDKRPPPSYSGGCFWLIETYQRTATFVSRRTFYWNWTPPLRLSRRRCAPAHTTPRHAEAWSRHGRAGSSHPLLSSSHFWRRPRCRYDGPRQNACRRIIIERTRIGVNDSWRLKRPGSRRPLRAQHP